MPTGGTCVHAPTDAPDEMDDTKSLLQGSSWIYRFTCLEWDSDLVLTCICRFFSGSGCIPLKFQARLCLMFLWCDAIIALYTQKITTHRPRRRHQATQRWPTRGAPGRMLLWGLVLIGLLDACHSGTSDFSWMRNPLPQIKRLRCKKQRARPNDAHEPYFGVLTRAWLPEENIKAFQLQAKGDGNYLWRSVARFASMKWYKLKDRTIKHMKDIVIEKSHEWNEIRKLSRKNASGNYIALCGAASLPDKPIKVITQQAIVFIDPPQGSREDAINLSLTNFHYSPMQRKSGKHIVYSHLTSFPVNIQQYVQLADEVPMTIKHLGRFGDKAFWSSRKGKSNTSKTGA